MWRSTLYSIQYWCLDCILCDNLHPVLRPRPVRRPRSTPQTAYPHPHRPPAHARQPCVRVRPLRILRCHKHPYAWTASFATTCILYLSTACACCSTAAAAVTVTAPAAAPLLARALRVCSTTNAELLPELLGPYIDAAARAQPALPRAGRHRRRRWIVSTLPSNVEIHTLFHPEGN